MIRNCHKKLFESKSAFAYMAIVALMAGVGSAMCAVGDIIWLLGDMAVQVHSHHFFVLSFLLPANLLIAVSFIYLYVGINKFLSKTEKKSLRREMVNVLKFKISKEEVDTTTIDIQIKGVI